MNLTVDASVFVAAARVEEIHYSTSRQFLLQARAHDATLFCPALVLPECAAAIARPTGDAALAEELIDLIEGFPGMQLIPLEVHLARQAAHAATNHRLGGAGSGYVAVADTFDATLITWDAEMLERGLGAVKTVTPSHWLDTLGIPG
jgi:predicted nucleic acid-binding protein